MEQPVCAQKRPYVLSVEPGTYWWCSCGQSAQQPFCDGSHKGSAFKPVKTELAEAETVAWCGCKRSGKGAFCDGTHSGLTETCP